MLYLYETTLPHDNNDEEVKKAYEISPVEKGGYIASFDFNNAEEGSPEVDSWLASQGILGRYMIKVV